MVFSALVIPVRSYPVFAYPDTSGLVFFYTLVYFVIYYLGLVPLEHLLLFWYPPEKMSFCELARPVQRECVVLGLMPLWM